MQATLIGTAKVNRTNFITPNNPLGFGVSDLLDRRCVGGFLVVSGVGRVLFKLAGSGGI